jgi:hypothetical protein
MTSTKTYLRYLKLESTTKYTARNVINPSFSVPCRYPSAIVTATLSNIKFPGNYHIELAVGEEQAMVDTRQHV